MEAVVAPVLQRKNAPPDAVSVVEPLLQMLGLDEVMLQLVALTTVTVVVHELVQPLAPVTVTV